MASRALRRSRQYLVLQVCRGRDSVAIVVRGDGNNTEITILKTDDSEDRVASEILSLYRNMKAESNYVLDPVCGMRVDPQKATAIVPSGSEDD